MSALGEATSSLPSRLGRYELISQIGQGGMAEVQLALQRGPAGFEKLVVVKLVHAHLATQKAFVDMLLDEARVAALVKHPNVVDIYDLGQVDGRFFIAMEYLEGEPLLAVLRAGREGTRLDPLSTARLIADTAEGLDAAHELRSMSGDLIGLVHHDVSLGNIVVLYNGQVKLVDFGVAKAASMTAVAAPNQIQGKFAYMAPEKLRGNPGDRRSDIWSLGVVLWEALTLRRLFRGGNDSDTMKQVLESKIPAPSTVNADVPADLDAVVMRALQRAPEDRYPTAKEMADALEEVLRKQGYGGRNDLIAKYMRATFETHIVARKKLLQEVSSKGRASAAVLEAAFDEATRQSNVDLSGKFAMPEGTPQRVGRKTAGLPSYTVASAMASAPGAAVDADAGATTVDVPAPKRPAIKPLHLALAGGAALLLVIVLAFALGGDGGDGKQLQAALADAAPMVTPPPAPDAPEVVAVPVDAAEDAGSAAGSGSGSDAGSADLELPPDRVGPGPASGAIRRPPPRPNAVELQRQGLKEFVSGDYRSALTTLKRAQVANPGYAPTWRTLGMVYENLGQKGAAKSAFQRYLTLAPKAPDAAAIRARMGP